MADNSGPVAPDPFDAANRADPYPAYAVLRERAPVHRLPGGAWLLTRYEHASAVLRGADFGVDVRRLADLDRVGSLGPARRSGLTLLFLDPPDHSRLRALVSRAFTPRMVAAMRPRVRELAADLLADAAAEPVVDLLAEVTYPLAVSVICTMLGVPERDHDLFDGWSRQATRLLDSDLGPGALAVGYAGATQLVEYFDALVAERRAAPGDDLLSALLAAEQAGDRLTPEELRGTLVLLFVAGHETTANLVGLAVLALLDHPAELARLRAAPGLLESAAEELFRYDTPVQLTARIALRDVEIGGVRIGAGEEVAVGIGAANRDPAEFPDPDRIVLDRRPNRHLSFGAGAHYCLGGALARVELQELLAELLARAPGLALEPGSGVDYLEHVALRCPRALPVLR